MSKASDHLVGTHPPSSAPASASGTSSRRFKVELDFCIAGEDVPDVSQALRIKVKDTIMVLTDADTVSFKDLIEKTTTKAAQKLSSHSHITLEKATEIMTQVVKAKAFVVIKQVSSAPV